MNDDDEDDCEMWKFCSFFCSLLFSRLRQLFRSTGEKRTSAEEKISLNLWIQRNWKIHEKRSHLYIFFAQFRLRPFILRFSTLSLARSSFCCRLHADEQNEKAQNENEKISILLREM